MEGLSVGAGSADIRKLGAVDITGSDVIAFSVLLVEPKAVLDDVSPGAPKGLLAVGIGIVNLIASWPVEVVAFVSNTPLEVEEDVPNPEEPFPLCEAPLFVDSAAVPKIELVVVEDEGCTSVAEVVLGISMSEGESFVRNSPPVVAEDGDSIVPEEGVDHIDLRASWFEETALVSYGLLVEGALELFLLGLPLVDLKRPFAGRVLDAVLVEKSKPGKRVALGDVNSDASPFAVVPRWKSVELAFEAESLANIALKSNRLPFGVAFDTPLREDVAFEPNRLGDEDLDVSL